MSCAQASISGWLELLNESDSHRIAVGFSLAGLDGGDDSEDDFNDYESHDRGNADDCTDTRHDEDAGNEEIDEEGDLEVEGLFGLG